MENTEAQTLSYLEKYGVLIPTKDLIISINQEIINYRKTFGQNDP